MQHRSPVPDIRRIKRRARALSPRDGSMTYMQYLDQVARQDSPLTHCLQSLQEYYLDP